MFKTKGLVMTEPEVHIGDNYIQVIGNLQIYSGDPKFDRDIIKAFGNFSNKSLLRFHIEAKNLESKIDIEDNSVRIVGDNLRIHSGNLKFDQIIVEALHQKFPNRILNKTMLEFYVVEEPEDDWISMVSRYERGFLPHTPKRPTG